MAALSDLASVAAGAPPAVDTVAMAHDSTGCGTGSRTAWKGSPRRRRDCLLDASHPRRPEPLSDRARDCWTNGQSPWLQQAGLGVGVGPNGAACLLALVVVGCSSRSPFADTASPSVRDTEKSVGEQGIEVVAKHAGAPPGPGHVWVGWAHSRQVLQDLWASFGLDGDPPQLSGEAVVLAATGEISSCPI